MRYEEHEMKYDEERTVGEWVKYIAGIALMAAAVAMAVIAIWTGTWLTWGLTAAVALLVGVVLWGSEVER